MLYRARYYGRSEAGDGRRSCVECIPAFVPCLVGMVIMTYVISNWGAGSACILSGTCWYWELNIHLSGLSCNREAVLLSLPDMAGIHLADGR